MGMLAIMKDFGWNMYGEVYGDASAALGIINRRGLGRTRHIDTGLLWIQKTAAEKRLAYYKVLGTDNPADLMTKHLCKEVIEKHCSSLGVEFLGGRALTAPALHNVQGTRALWQAEEESEGQDVDGMLEQVQIAVNKAWLSNWKKHVKARRDFTNSYNTATTKTTTDQDHERDDNDGDNDRGRHRVKDAKQAKEAPRQSEERQKNSSSARTLPAERLPGNHRHQK